MSISSRLPFATARAAAERPLRAAAARAACHPRHRGGFRAASELQAALSHACTAILQDSRLSLPCARRTLGREAAWLSDVLFRARGGLARRVVRT